MVAARRCAFLIGTAGSACYGDLIVARMIYLTTPLNRRISQLSVRQYLRRPAVIDTLRVRNLYKVFGESRARANTHSALCSMERAEEHTRKMLIHTRCDDKRTNRKTYNL